MDSPDLPKPYERIAKNDKQDVSTASEEAKERLFKELFEIKPSDINRTQRAGNTTMLSDIGQIDRINLPANWSAGQTSSNIVGTSTFREFRPPEEKDVKLFFHYRGIRTDETSANAFHDILEKPAHALSTEEIKSLGATLRDKGNPDWFQITAARTEDLNGKRVLVVQGRFKKHEVEAQTVFVDADGTGSVVQEIEYQAPTGKFAQYQAAAKQSFRSIVWK